MGQLKAAFVCSSTPNIYPMAPIKISFKAKQAARGNLRQLYNVLKSFSLAIQIR